MNVKINGPALRELRKLAGYNGAELAEKVGCSAAYISMLETKPNRTCSPGVFGRICDALRLDDRRVLLRDHAPATEAA